MDFTYDEEQQALREAVRGLVGKAYSDFENRRRTAAEDPGFSEKVWTQLAEMGILGLPFDEQYGGMGAGAIEVGIVAQEIGRVVAPEPFLTSVVLAGGLIAATGSEEQKTELLGALSGGELVPTFAHAEPGSRWQPTASGVTATEAGDGWTLSGVKEPVPNGVRADVLVVSAALPDGGTGLFVVAGDASGLSRDGYATHDGGRAAKVTLSETPATPLGDAADRAGVIGRVLDIARITACNEAIGLMEVALENTTAYLKSRKQFGVTLNTFQALNFRSADMYVSLELARSLATWASMVLAEGSGEEASTAAARASLGVSRAGRHIGQEAIQLHGGIGMTAEYSIGTYTSRLTALDHLLGDGNHHLGLLAAGVGGYDEVDPLP
ncbi:acyl-CoA dehydrogenase [Nocardioides sp. Root1257]|uniref:acyl-CoA dehydrogenase family protein n=1 Tax=unclassified Nocardioides TaxID=2615069 RepID=UPI0006F23C50|nr:MULTISPECIES: acyl-CoA dehydrogenase [unclassified Nocardioides]KQW49096.1 acyl-CoA dehydrogenase [Nocardioides sp. Root1257]KRC48270.1 acyl-CoA dehydrogenase [Nocardioides sp. Root224]